MTCALQTTLVTIDTAGSRLAESADHTQAELRVAFLADRQARAAGAFPPAVGLS